MQKNPVLSFELVLAFWVQRSFDQLINNATIKKDTGTREAVNM